MARIRSVHPSLFTDEAWVSCSPLARILYIGLWTDADDQGLFEWKPLQIRMRLLPGDDADVGALLEELSGADLISPLQSGGKKLGAIRYFRRFQRPKKPNRTFVLPAEWVTYVGLGDEKPEPDTAEEGGVRNQFPTNGEKPPQMEDGGGRREEEPSEPNGSGEPPLDELSELRSLPEATGAWRLGLKVLMERGGLNETKARTFLGKLKQNGLDAAGLWRIAEAAWDAGTGDPLPYLAKAAEGAVADASTTSILNPSEVRQRAWMAEWRESPNSWRPERGPRPGEAGCRVSESILREHGMEPAMQGRAA